MSLVLEELSLRELLISLLGDDLMRRLKNRDKPNDQVFSEYLDIVSASKSHKWYLETKRLLSEFHLEIGAYPPSVELFTRFFKRYAKLSASTRSRYYFVFSAFFRWYNGQTIPFKIKVPKLVPQSPSDDDIARIEQAMQGKRTHKKLLKRDLVLIKTNRHTGLRRAELSDLIVSDLHLTDPIPYVLVRHGKGSKQRIIPLNDTIRPILADFTREKKPEDSIFNLAPKTISMKINYWARKAGVKIHTHSFRHKFATDILNRGGSVRALQKLLGHESLATTEVYLDATDDSLKDAVNLLQDENLTASGDVAGKGTRYSLVSKIMQGLELKGNVDEVLVDQVKRHVNVIAEIAKCVYDVQKFICNYQKGENFNVFESKDLPGMFTYDPLPRKGQVPGSFVSGTVFFDLPAAEYFFQHLRTEFPALDLKEWQELVTSHTPLPKDVVDKIGSLGNNARFFYCPSCKVCNDLVL